MFDKADDRLGNTKHTVRITPAAYRAYKESIAVNPPETFALIGGSLDDPMLITDFHFMAPRRDERGSFVASGAFVYPDHEQVNYIIDNVLVRKDHYILGLWHSHPGALNSPSGPDLEFCGRIIANDDSKGLRWNHFLAPITTFNEDGRDTVTAWVLPKHGRRFEAADFAVEGVPASIPDRRPVTARWAAAPDGGSSVFGVVDQIHQLAQDIERVHRRLDFIQAYRIGRDLAHARSVVAACGIGKHDPHPVDPRAAASQQEPSYSRAAARRLLRDGDKLLV